MKKITLLLLLLLCISCDIQYDGETKLVMETNLVDTDGEPLANKSIDVVITAGQLSDVISSGVTDSNGRLILIFPSPKNDSAKVQISVYDDDIHQMKFVSNIKKTDFTDYKLSLPDLMLFRHDQITTLEVVLNQTNADNRLNMFYIVGATPNEFEDYNSDSEINTFFDDATIRLLKNQEVVLHYSVTDMQTSVTTLYTIPITIGIDPTPYTLNY